MTAPDFTPAQEALLRQAAAQPAPKAAELLLGLAKSFWRAGEDARFAECTRRAAVLAPAGDVAAVAQDAGDAREHRDQARALVRYGMRDAATLARLALAQARLGEAAAARRLFDIDRFLHCGEIGAPDGMTVADFHAALAREIKAKLSFYERPDYRAIRDGWRHNEVFHSATPALQALKAMLEAQIARYAAALPRDAEHPFLSARPARLRMEGWAVVSGPKTHHTPHIHPDAWATGVFYVVQPPVSRAGRRGWLRIGPPPQAGLGPAQGCDTKLIEPRPGSFVLMPAYFFHDTEPMGVDEERICVAFEVLADESAPQAP